jgi:hypothetical protein
MRQTGQPGSDRGALVCSHCGRVVSRLHSAEFSATIPGGKMVHRGDLICEECQRDLGKEFSEEQVFTRPPD